MPVRELHWIRFLVWASGLAYLVTSGAAASDEDVWQRGRHLVIEHGCLGCHKIDSQGGNLGPDITYAGDKAVRDLDVTHVEGERTLANWMFTHFTSPTAALPGAVKPNLGLSEDEARDLASYMVRLKRKAAPTVGIPLPRSVKRSVFISRGPEPWTDRFSANLRRISWARREGSDGDAARQSLVPRLGHGCDAPRVDQTVRRQLVLPFSDN